MADGHGGNAPQVMRSPLGRARGLGSAKSGLHHWQVERLTALALVPLTLWFVWAILSHLGAPQPAVAAWAGSPVNAALLIALTTLTFHHLQLGLQVVWEDYIRKTGQREAAILLTRGASLLLGLLAIVSILKLVTASH